MKRYKPLFSGIRDNFLFNEAVIKVDAYDKILYSLFDKCKPHIQNKNLPVDQIITILNKEFSFLKIVFQAEKINNSDDAHLGFNGGGTEDDEYNTIYVFLNSNCESNFNQYNNKYIATTIKIIHHELIHRNQAIRMKSREIISKEFNYDPDNYREYLQQKIEIMPFAFMVVEESRAHGWNDDKILQNLKTFSNPSALFNGYLKYFDEDSKTVKLLVKYMYMYLQK